RMAFEFKSLSLPGVQVAIQDVYRDERGYLLESFDKSVFSDAGIGEEFVLDFYSKSQKNTIRGLHIQDGPAAQAKLVHVIEGKVFDVIVDVRRDSNCFGEYITRTLSGKNKEVIYVPEGFAHGYLVQEDDTIVHYKGSHEYTPKHICGLAWDDPYLDIEWPIDCEPIVSDQDANWPTLEEWRND
uniref:dTDP-4-dehydrorhamnose 3,5-epimerase n=1 Tax=Halorhabdus salina TaxID=2750670 RepID=UPI001C6731A2